MGPAEFVRRHGLELEPWQLNFLEALEGGEQVSWFMPPRGCGRQRVHEIAIAATIASGHPVRIVAASEAQAEVIRQRALDLLDGLGP